ncbi:MAG: sigma-54 dependent transcriptional regulator [Thermodesulfobacteriota bacterium]|nr:sigma-54 dependent transcriptional regulator [Thermodesulfobacteriota bacterium]
MSKSHILVIDDEENMRHVLTAILRKEGYVADTCPDAVSGLKKLEEQCYDQVLCDICMSGMDGLSFLKEVVARNFDTTVIVMSAYGSIDTAIEAIKLGAYDYIDKPFKPNEIILTLKKAEERARLRRENTRLKEEVERNYSFSNIIAKSEAMLQIFDMVKKIADYKTTVLILGESGTGKELIAKAIHYNSVRRDKPLITINCGGIPETLLESELFGHVKGAFTDAYRAKKGLFEEAHGGTLFLDEVGELPMSLQVKLLRALQEEEIRPLGDTRATKVDVRIIAATARDLAREVEKNTFRDDLFYRLNVLSIHVPPLRERREDIPLLVDHFIQKYNNRLGTNVERISPEAMHHLMEYEWRGNVRELENVIERAMVLTESKIIGLEYFPSSMQKGSDTFSHEILNGVMSIKKASKSVERELIKRALVQTKGNRTQAAHILEVSLPALLYKMKEYKIAATT